MDSHDIFKKLTLGAKFNVRKFESDAVKFNVLRRNNNSVKLLTEVKNDADNEETFKTVSVKSEIKNDTDEELTLLGSMTTGKRKKKKQKQDNNAKKQMLEQEEINHYRNVNRISVIGSEVPAPIKNFSELEIGQDLIDNINQCGYTKPTAVQKQAIPVLLKKTQLLACAPTGSGKTAAFLVPIIHSLGGPQRQGFRAVIVVPTRELAKQIHRECFRLSASRGLRTHIISKINKAVEKFGPKSSQKCDILVTTPNRLCYLLKQEPPVINLSSVEWLIIDEADKLFETGVRGFRDQLTDILTACSNPNRKIAMFSATHTVDVGKWCRRNIKNYVTLTVGARNAATETVEQKLLFVGNEAGKLLAIRDLVRKGVTPPVLVFVQSKERAQQLFTELIYDGLNIDVIHADRTQLQRDNTVRAFREGRVWFLICTELMARGIDFKGVNLVINYDFPPSAISYVHRIGRAGRAGKTGKAVTFFTTDDTINLRIIAQVMRQSGCEVPDYMLRLPKRAKRHRKKLEVSAPEREDITTIPAFELQRRAKRREKIKQARLKKLGQQKDSEIQQKKDKNKKVTKVAKVVKRTKKTPNKKMSKKVTFNMDKKKLKNSKGKKTFKRKNDFEKENKNKKKKVAD